MLYYSEVQSFKKKVVICNPNIIFTRITDLIALSFGGADPNRSDQAQVVRKFGEIEFDLMKIEKEREEKEEEREEEEEKREEKSVFTMGHVIDLLMHYDIISKMNKPDGSHSYFMPCLLLPDPNAGKEDKQALRKVNPAPLLILFNTEYVPLGLFSALVVHLSSLDSWDVDPQKQRYRNKVQFVVDNETCTDLVLISHIDHLELHIKSKTPMELPNVCPSVLSVLQEAIATLKDLHKYLKFFNELGFYCSYDLPLDSGPAHSAVCLGSDSRKYQWEKVKPRFMRCRHKKQCPGESFKLQDEHHIWFGQVINVLLVTHMYTYYVRLS